MQLWTEYEGATIDGAFILEKLLLSEGRSAFFSALNGNGAPTLLRLIASHFDEDEILARWRGVDTLGHPNILKIERYGQITLDDTTMVYAIFEPVDASLADVLAGQRLTVPETKELALSLASALEVLHRNGFVHEHLEPAKVFAVGEVVKLRGDCIRETPEGEQGQEIKRKDVHDLAVVILLALTGMETLEEARRFGPLPSPLDEIVPNALRGTWGLGQILALLDVGKRAEGKIESKPVPSTPTGVVATERVNGNAEKPKEATAAVVDGPVVPATVAIPVGPQIADGSTSGRGNFTSPREREPWQPGPKEGLGPRFPISGPWIAVIGLAVVLVFWVIWHEMHRSTPATGAGQANPTTSSAGAATAGAIDAGGRQAVAGKPSAAGQSTQPIHPTQKKNPLPPPQVVGTGGREQWRVVAFTYNRADQAQKKADTVAQKYGDLRPEVFTPSGRAPYLVTVGGAMSRDQAFALVQRARRMGLPHDIYAQNYKGK